MILEVQHETRLEYTDPRSSEWLAEMRMEPLSDEDQSCRTFHLVVSPSTGIYRYQDGFGNNVHHFNLLAPGKEVRILSASIVETHARPRHFDGSRATWPLALEDAPLEIHDFLNLRGPVRSSPRLEALVERLQPRQGDSLVEWIHGVMKYLKTQFKYARDVTLASSPIDDILQYGKGVCQDFAHLMIAIMRSYNVPARYVSGYFHRPNKESQSHAWIEVWLPDIGWHGVDPTNGCVTNGDFVKVALGRDFSDVPPNKGVYRGQATENIFVRVETRILDTLPARSWQEQLPPLNVPLTAIIPRLRFDPEEAELFQQQQQQQQ